MFDSLDQTPRGRLTRRGCCAGGKDARESAQARTDGGGKTAAQWGPRARSARSSDRSRSMVGKTHNAAQAGLVTPSRGCAFASNLLSHPANRSTADKPSCRGTPSISSSRSVRCSAKTRRARRASAPEEDNSGAAPPIKTAFQRFDVGGWPRLLEPARNLIGRPCGRSRRMPEGEMKCSQDVDGEMAAHSSCQLQMTCLDPLALAVRLDCVSALAGFIPKKGGFVPKRSRRGNDAPS